MLSPVRRRQPALRARGVTLIEIAVVLVVIGLSLMAILPEVGTWIRTLRLRSAADALTNGLQTARMEALRRNGTVTFTLMTDGGGTLSDACAASNASASWVVSLDADPSGQCSASPSATPTAAPRLLAKYSATDASQVTVQADGQHVVFNSFGQVVSDGATLTTIALTQQGARSLTVQVNSAGRVRMCDPAVADTDSRSCKH